MENFSQVPMNLDAMNFLLIFTYNVNEEDHFRKCHAVFSCATILMSDIIDII